MERWTESFGIQLSNAQADAEKEQCSAGEESTVIMGG